MSVCRGFILAVLLALLVPSQAWAQVGPPCPRPGPGVLATPPEDLYSQNGVLNVNLNYYTSVEGPITLWCFVDAANGNEAPTLHINPGDTLNITLTNMVPGNPAGGSVTIDYPCASPTMTSTSVNMHFHGTNTSPTCGSDEVIRTVINSGTTFKYSLQFPANEPPGLYWYHTHIHGIASPTVQGGASGVIEVEGIANLQPIVAGLPERFITIRDQGLLNPDALGATGQQKPFWDLSVDYVPVSWPTYTPAIFQMNPGAQEFWRVANNAADTIMHLQLMYDGVAQPLTLVALDGVPIGSQDGTQQGYTITQNYVYIPPASRAEFIVTGPGTNVHSAQLIEDRIDTGPAGDSDPYRPLVTIQTTQQALNLPVTPGPTGPPAKQRFANLLLQKVTAKRSLYFDERNFAGGGQTLFFITVKGQNEVQFNANLPPAITTNQGAVEEWTIENHTQELHEFHIHQIHFLLEKVDGVPVSPQQQQFYDTYQVAYWTGTNPKKTPYPSITVLMDFRGAVVGDFVYHCHILDHEDGGMMAKIRVLAAKK
ncbi:MAG: multicopper oxidase domain-containing protein [Rhizomicrobium sp.]|jgi:FtsP/CotA-like multicopper oxidase with cupredoxin domain